MLTGCSYMNNTVILRVLRPLFVVVVVQYLKECLIWLDAWEKYIKQQAVDTRRFLSPSTSAGLRVTLASTIELSQHLLDAGFSYILTSRFSQDPLEVHRTCGVA
jgi:hypothetical protein